MHTSTSTSTPTSTSGNAAHWAEENRHLAALIGQARNGDTDAFEQLYRRTARWLLSHVRKLVEDGLAEDVLADVYLQVWKGLATYDEQRAPPGVWLAMIARSRALDHLRGEKRTAHAHENARMEASMEADEAQGPEQLLTRSQRASLLHLCLGSTGLSAEERTVLGLAYFREHTQGEIAAITGWPLGTVKGMLARSQEKLRARMAAGWPELARAPGREARP